MEQVTRSYGRFLLDAMAVLLLIGALFFGATDAEGNRGLPAIIGARVPEEEPAGSSDFEEFAIESRKAFPTFSFSGGGALVGGEYGVSDIVTARDYRGQALPVSVRSIIDPTGAEQIGAYVGEVSRVQFAIRGIYTLKVAATDAWNRTEVATVKVPVNDE